MKKLRFTAVDDFLRWYVVVASLDSGQGFSSAPGTSCNNSTTLGNFFSVFFSYFFPYPQNNNRSIKCFIFTFSIYFEHSSSILLSIEKENVHILIIPFYFVSYQSFNHTFKKKILM